MADKNPHVTSVTTAVVDLLKDAMKPVTTTTSTSPATSYSPKACAPVRTPQRGYQRHVQQTPATTRLLSPTPPQYGRPLASASANVSSVVKTPPTTTVSGAATATTATTSAAAPDQDKVNQLDRTINLMIQHMEDNAERRISALMMEIRRKAEKEGVLAQIDARFADFKNGVEQEIQDIRQNCGQVGQDLVKAREAHGALSEKLSARLGSIDGDQAALRIEVESSQKCLDGFRRELADHTQNEHACMDLLRHELGEKLQAERESLDTLRSRVSELYRSEKEDVDMLRKELRTQSGAGDMVASQLEQVSARVGDLEVDKISSRALIDLEAACRTSLETLNGNLLSRIDEVDAQHLRSRTDTTKAMDTALQSLESVVRADLDSMNHTISGIFRKVEAENERRDAEIRNDFNTFSFNLDANMAEVKRWREARLPEDLEEMRAVVHDLAGISRTQGESLQKITHEMERQRQNLVTHRMSIDQGRLLDTSSRMLDGNRFTEQGRLLESNRLQPVEPLSMSRIILEDSFSSRNALAGTARGAITDSPLKTFMSLGNGSSDSNRSTAAPTSPNLSPLRRERL